jgi:hypothetical protein
VHDAVAVADLAAEVHRRALHAHATASLLGLAEPRHGAEDHADLVLAGVPVQLVADVDDGEGHLESAPLRCHVDRKLGVKLGVGADAVAAQSGAQRVRLLAHRAALEDLAVHGNLTHKVPSATQDGGGGGDGGARAVQCS